MGDMQYLFQTEALSIGQARPCAEEPGHLQVEGQARAADRGAIAERLKSEGWRVTVLGNPATLIASLKGTGMLILGPEGDFTFSRIPDLEAGCAFLRGLFQPVA